MGSIHNRTGATIVRKQPKQMVRGWPGSARVTKHTHDARKMGSNRVDDDTNVADVECFSGCAFLCSGERCADEKRGPQ